MYLYYTFGMLLKFIDLYRSQKNKYFNLETSVGEGTRMWDEIGLFCVYHICLLFEKQTKKDLIIITKCVYDPTQ